MDADDIERMLVEVTLGKPPSLRTPEADALRARMEEWVKKIRAEGGVVDVHHDIPGLPGSEEG